MKSRYLTVDECHALGVEPYAVYGGKVYSFKRTISRSFIEAIPHGSRVYASHVAEADKAGRNDRGAAVTVVGFNKNLEDGQLVIKTLSETEYVANPDAADCGNDFGYWLTRYNKTFREFQPLAKFVNQEAIDALAEGLGQMIVYWPEGD